MAARSSAKRTARKKRRAGRADSELIKMSELAKRSGVPGPTIKHYIREGLLPGPEVRTSRNMAYYDARLAARIRVIKSLQAERFLPLRVIGELLESAPSAALRSDRDTQRKALTALAPAISNIGDRGEKRRKRADVMKTVGVTRAELDRLEKVGILELRGTGETAGYSGLDLDLLDLLGDIRRLGLGSVFPPSIAEGYLAAVKALVAIEIDVFRRHALTAGELAVPLPEVARHAVGFGERLVVALRAKLLPAMLEQIAVGGIARTR